MKTFRTLKFYNYYPKTYDELKKVLKIKAEHKDNDLNDIDVSLLDSIGGFHSYRFFQKNDFYVDEWDVSNVKYFNPCFYKCYKFNCDLSNWDVSNGIIMSGFLFYSLKFNQNINHFDLSNAIDINSFLNEVKSFNQPLDKFKFNYKIISLSSFFEKCVSFNQDISMWDVSNIIKFDFMFFYTKNFLQNLSGWDVSKAKYWNLIFVGSKMENHLELMPEKFRKDYIK